MISLHIEDLLVFDLGDAHDQQRDQFSELGDTFPQTQNDCLFEQPKHGVEDLQVYILLVAFFDKSLDELQYAVEIKLLLFFFLALEGSFGAVDVFLPDDASFFALMAIPSADVLDGLDGGELAVVDVDVVSDSHEGFVDIDDWVELDSVGFDTGLV